MEAFFFKNPFVRALLPLLLMGVVAFASDRLFMRIVGADSIAWGQIVDEPSFYIALIGTVVVAFYQIRIQRYDADLAQGFTPKQYEAAIRNQVAEEVAKRSRKLIQEGNIEKLKEETEAFKKLYGKNKS